MIVDGYHISTVSANSSLYDVKLHRFLHFLFVDKQPIGLSRFRWF